MAELIERTAILPLRSEGGCQQRHKGHIFSALPLHTYAVFESVKLKGLRVQMSAGTSRHFTEARHCPHL